MRGGERERGGRRFELLAGVSVACEGEIKITYTYTYTYMYIEFVCTYVCVCMHISHG